MDMSKILKSFLLSFCFAISSSAGHAENSKITTTDNSEVLIQDGSLLEDFHATQGRIDIGAAVVKGCCASKIKTPHGSIEIFKGAVVLICAEEDLTRFFVLCEPFGGSVRVTTNTHYRKATSGSEVDVIDSDTADSALQKVLRDGVRRRKLKMHPAGDNHFISTQQFSIPDAVLKQPVLVNLHTSQDKFKHRLYEKIVKTAAAISVSGSREPYSIHN